MPRHPGPAWPHPLGRAVLGQPSLQAMPAHSPGFFVLGLMGLNGPAQFTILSMDPFKSGPRPTNLTRLLDCVVMTFWIWKQKRIIYWSLFLSYAGEQLQTYCNGVQWVAPHLGPIMFWWVLGFIPPDPNLYFFLLMTLISLFINNMYANVRDNYFFIKCSTCLPPEKKEKKREDNPNQTCHKLQDEFNNAFHGSNATMQVFALLGSICLQGN